MNKRLKEEDKKEGPLKRLKNSEDKGEEQLKTTESKNQNIKGVTDFVEEPLSLEGKSLIEEIKMIERYVDYRKLKITGRNGIPYIILVIIKNLELFRNIYYRTFKINKAERKEDEFNVVLNALSKYSPRDLKYIETKISF